MRKYQALLIVCCFLCTLVSAQENLAFHHLTIDEGMCDDNVQCVLRDHKGFLWIGTANGLCRYDGSRFTTYRNDPEDPASISNNSITCLLQQQKDELWIGTYYGGVNKFSSNDNRFSPVSWHDEAGNIAPARTIATASLYDSDHILVTDGSLHVFNTKINIISELSLPLDTWSGGSSYHTSEKFFCSRLFIDRQKKWWLTGEEGIIAYTPGKGFDLVSLRRDIPKLFNLASTWDCTEDKNGNIWIASAAGLFEYDRQQDRFIQHYPSKFSRADVRTSFVRCVFCDDDGSVWFGTSNGLFHYFPATGKYFTYRNDPLNSSSITNNDITCLYKDHQNILWIGTVNGLNAVYPVITPFASYRNLPNNNNSLRSDITGGSIKDDEGNVWIGTQNGLEMAEHATGKFHIYTYFDKRLKEQTAYYVFPLTQNDSSTFWVGTWGAGMQLFNFKTKKFLQSFVDIVGNPATLNNNFITTFCKDGKGNLWIGTWGGGINKFDISKQTFRHFSTADIKSGLPTNNIVSLCYANNTLWAGCSKGLLKYDSVSNRFKLFRFTKDTNNIPATAVNQIVAGDDNTLWIGRFPGLIKYYPEKDSFQKISLFDNVTVSGILLDKQHTLWLGTNEGLKHYNPNTGELFSYTLKDGLPGRSFPGHCYFLQSADGEIFANTMNGLLHFYPETIRGNVQAPPLYFTSIKIKDQELKKPGDLSRLHSLDLAYNQDYITINFAALNFINPLFNKYAYQLTGVDKDWVYSENRNEVIYTNLQPGNYTFKVKASNDAGVWNNEGISLHIHVSAPWWETWWFYILCAIAVATVLYAFYNVHISRLKAIYGMRSNIARDLHDEIGSTLTSINILSKLSGRYIESDHDKVKGMVDEINEQSLQIQQSMGDIVWAINPENDKLETMVARMREFIAHTLEPKNAVIDFRVDEAITKDSLTMQQRRDFLLIFKEAINNIAKYAECNKVKISLTRQNGNIELMVADDGIGFDTTKITSSNGLKNMKARADALNGIIRIHSVQGKGTVIELKVPIS